MRNMYKKAQKCLLCGSLELSCKSYFEDVIDKEDIPDHTETHYCEDGSRGVLIWAGWKFDTALPDNYSYQG